MKIVFDYGGATDPECVAEELRRVADMLEQGFTSGELVDGEGDGWWSVEQGESA